jgi:hypothetical protein
MTTTDYPSLALVRDGRPDVPGPLSQLGLGRSGRWYVIASGRANHAGMGHWPGLAGSSESIGIEAEHPGGSTPWTDVQYDSYVAGVAALVDHLGSDTIVIGHKEWAPTRKVDPTFDMSQFRRDVTEWNDEMITRDSKADEGNPALAEVMARAIAAGVATIHTQPGGVAFNDEVVAMIERAINPLVNRIKALEASGGSVPHQHTFQGTTGLSG